VELYVDLIQGEMQLLIDIQTRSALEKLGLSAKLAALKEVEKECGGEG
jgi:hypothetical protein